MSMYDQKVDDAFLYYSIELLVVMTKPAKHGCSVYGYVYLS